MYKVIIIDDEKAAIETLRRDLEVQTDLEIKGTAGNGAKGIYIPIFCSWT